MAKKQSMTMVLVDRSQDILKKLDGFGRCAEEIVQEIRENAQDNHGLRRESASELAKYERMTRRPFDVRMVLENEDTGEQEIYYLCENPPSNLSHFFPNEKVQPASYFSPIGSFAALPVGRSKEVVRNHEVTYITVVEIAKIDPDRFEDEWDAALEFSNSAQKPRKTISSIRDFLEANNAKIARECPDQELTSLYDIFAEDDAEALVQDGRVRKMIQNMKWRRLPTLDEIQDEIFRLPASTKLIILGAPGTGKTTTLIKRLAMKFSSEGDLKDYQSSLPLNEDWVMFTPTELLKNYLRDAFNAEGIPANSVNITTWNDFRVRFCRFKYGFLADSNNQRGGIYRETVTYLNSATQTQSQAWYASFSQLLGDVFLDNVLLRLTRLADLNNPALNQVKDSVELARNSLGSISDRLPPIFLLIENVLGSLSQQAQTLKDEVKKALEDVIYAQYKEYRPVPSQFPEDLVKFLKQVEEEIANKTANGEPENIDDEDDEDDDDPYADVITKTEKKRAQQVLTRELRKYIRFRSQGRTSKSYFHNRLLKWLNQEQLPSLEQCRAIGTKIVHLESITWLSRSLSHYFKDILKSYQKFREFNSGPNSPWYTRAPSNRRNVAPLELDLLMLAAFDVASKLLTYSKPRGLAGYWQSLEPFAEAQRMQVLVDELTDFSSLQLRIMLNLARVNPGSFMATGDINQRMTDYGITSESALREALPGIEIKKISVAYRQSFKLHQFCISLLKLFGGDVTQVNLPSDVSEKDLNFSPMLRENVKTVKEAANVVAEGIRTIERLLGQEQKGLPSTAVFVKEENLVEPFAKDLQKELAEINVPVEACLKGQIQTKDNTVRVFNIEYIKGLEFETVFFIDIDQMADRKEVYAKLLYVGATRAATFLGITCHGTLPEVLVPLAKNFVSSWNTDNH